MKGRDPESEIGPPVSELSPINFLLFLSGSDRAIAVAKEWAVAEYIGTKGTCRALGTGGPSGVIKVEDEEEDETEEGD